MAWVVLILGLLALGVYSGNVWFYVVAGFFGTIGTFVYLVVLGLMKAAAAELKKNGSKNFRIR